jgi:hypothetical protein
MLPTAASEPPVPVEPPDTVPSKSNVVGGVRRSIQKVDILAFDTTVTVAIAWINLV